MEIIQTLIQYLREYTQSNQLLKKLRRFFDPIWILIALIVIMGFILMNIINTMIVARLIGVIYPGFKTLTNLQ